MTARKTALPTRNPGGRPPKLKNRTQRYLQKECGGYAFVARNLDPPLCRQAVAKWGDRDEIPEHQAKQVKRIAAMYAKAVEAAKKK